MSTLVRLNCIDEQTRNVRAKSKVVVWGQVTAEYKDIGGACGFVSSSTVYTKQNCCPPHVVGMPWYFMPYDHVYLAGGKIDSLEPNSHPPLYKLNGELVYYYM